MASTDSLDPTVPNHPGYQLDHYNSSNNAAALSISPSDGDAHIVVDPEAATPMAGIDSTDDASPLHVETSNEEQQFAKPLSSPVVDSNPGDEELSQSDITIIPIHSPDTECHPQSGLDLENHQTPAPPKPSHEPHLAAPPHTRQTDILDEGNDNHPEYPGSNTDGPVSLPAPLVCPHEGPIPVVSPPADLHPSILGEFVQPITVSSPFLPSIITISDTIVPQRPPSTTTPFTPLSNPQEEPAQNTQPLKAEIPGSSPEIDPPKPLRLQSLENPKPRRRLLRKKTRPTMFTPDSAQKNQMETQYVNMLLALDTIPAREGRKANFFTWILMAGFVTFPGTFTSLPNFGGAAAGTGTGTGVDQRLLHVITHVPIFIVAWVCTAIGGLGMLWLTWKWHKNYIWVLRRIFVPGFKSSLAGFISNINIIKSAQHGQLGGSSLITVIIVSGTTGICLLLILTYSYWLKHQVKAKHDSEVGVQLTGRFGEGVADPLTRKAKHSDVETANVDLGLKDMILSW